MILIKTVF